jgi:hypothetical protein
MSAWMLPKITDYWDDRVRAIDTASSSIGALGAAPRAAALQDIRAAVTEHVRVLPDEMLVRAAVPIIDDLYRAACSTDRWDDALADYLEASAGTFTRLLLERGYLVQYLIDNAWEDMTRPTELFDAWYQASGLVYVCPQRILVELLPNDPQEHSPDSATPLAGDIDEARDIAMRLVQGCQESSRHFVQLDTDRTEDSYATAFARCGEAGVLMIFRAEAPEPGSNVQVWQPAAVGAFR